MDLWYSLHLEINSVNGDIDGVIASLAQGGRVAFKGPRGFTPLIIAAQNGHTDICGLLLAHGSNVNEVVPDTKHTALHLAVESGKSSVVEALLGHGAQVHVRGGKIGEAPLHIACRIDEAKGEQCSK